MTWTRANRRTTWGPSGRFFETPYLLRMDGAELDFSFTPFSRTIFTFRHRGRDFEFTSERDHDIPPLSQRLCNPRPKSLPLVLGPDCLVRVWPKRETRLSWTEEVVADTSNGIKSALRALHRLAPEFCASPIEHIRFDTIADEFVGHSDYHEKIRPGDTPVWYLKCVGQYDFFPKIIWTSEPSVEAWTADVVAPGVTLPRFKMTGDLPMPDFFNIRRAGFPLAPLNFGKIISSRARDVIEAVAPDELSYRSLSIEMPVRMRPTDSYFLIAPTRNAQMVDWDRSPKILSEDALPPRKVTVSGYHHVGHLIFRDRKPGDPHMWREIAPISDSLYYAMVPKEICMSQVMWTAISEAFPGQLDPRSRSA